MGFLGARDGRPDPRRTTRPAPRQVLAAHQVHPGPPTTPSREDLVLAARSGADGLAQA